MTGHSAAYIQGLRTNDVIRRIGGSPIPDDKAFRRYHDRMAPASSAVLLVWRDQASRELTLTKPAH